MYSEHGIPYLWVFKLEKRGNWEMTEDTINDRISETIGIIVDVLNLSGYDANIGAAAMINLLVNCAMDSGQTKEAWLCDMSNGWDHYEKERAKECLNAVKVTVKCVKPTKTT